MKKMIYFLMALMFFACASPSFASVGIKVDNTVKGAATDLKFYGGNSVKSPIAGDGTFNLIVAGTGTSGAISMTTDQTDVLPGYTLVRKAIASNTSSPSYSTGHLANGTPGQHLTIFITVKVDSGTFVLSPDTKTGFQSITFDAVGDMATLLYVDDTTGWVLVSHTAVTVTQVP